VIAAGALLAGLSIPAAPAQAAVAFAAGHVWASQPATPAYFATTGYEYNSTGDRIHITRLAAGTYRVRFLSMATNGGIGHASAYGGGNSDFCTVVNYGPSGADLSLRVNCYDGDGNLSDSRFVAHFTNRKPAAGAFSYAWSSDATPPAGGYTPPASWSHDSAGEPVTIESVAVGRYRVYLGSVSASDFHDGYFRATAYGAAPVRCEVLDPALQDPGMVPVNCYDIDGFEVNSRFTLSYSRDLTVLATATPSASALVWPSNGGPVVVDGWLNPGGMPTATELGEGSFLVTFPGAAAPRGHAIASVFSTPPAYCNVAGWWPWGADLQVWVNCYDGSEHELEPVLAFNVAFMA
jgi:hypothetical protein